MEPFTWTFIFSFFVALCIVQPSESVKCLDCVGRNCMESFCEGDYCVLAHYAPRWGSTTWGEPRVVKGCMTGTMIRSDIRSHCETVDEDEEEVFTCFCDSKDYCNGNSVLKKLEIQPVPLLTCVCDGPHCKSSTCLGELCSYVINHKSKAVEQGCVNASVPLVERRSAGSCMSPPITGAMHHTVAQTPEELIWTESCVCGSDYCNKEKPVITVKETMKCTSFARTKMMGTTIASRNISCDGEFCFKAKIKSNLEHKVDYATMGCASFIDEAELAEELNPVGCASFQSENIEVETCFKTNDKRAIGRARANQEMTTPRRKSKSSKSRTKPKIEVTYDDDEEEEKEEKEEEEEPKPEKPKSRPQEDTDDDYENPKEKEKEEKTAPHYIFERPTMAPVPDDSNVALISVFLLIIVLIALSGLVWKLELHKKLFRSSYDTVAGG